MTAILAGFECGRLGWNGHDLLATTRHLGRAIAWRNITGSRGQHGLARARDGLPWRHDAAARIRIAQAAGLDVIWDLNHFDPPEDPVAHARRVAEAAHKGTPLWVCPVNEPSVYPLLCGMPRDEAVRLAITMGGVLRQAPSRRPFPLHVDPITGIGERQFAATDALVAAGLADVVGVNYYPHTARTSLRKVLTKVARRYRRPILVSETSWHDGHPAHHRQHPGWTKGDWLRHILDEIAIAEAGGAEIVGLCWYPLVDSPPWNRPRSRHRWSHGLIRQDLGVDPHLAAALAEGRVTAGRPDAPRQLAFDYGLAS